MNWRLNFKFQTQSLKRRPKSARALLTGILQEGDDLWESFVHRLQSFLLTARSTAGRPTDPLALTRPCPNPDQLRCERLVGEGVDDREIYIGRRTTVSVRRRRLAVGESQYPEEIDRLGAVDTRKYIVTGVSGLRVRAWQQTTWTSRES